MYIVYLLCLVIKRVNVLYVVLNTRFVLENVVVAVRGKDTVAPIV